MSHVGKGAILVGNQLAEQPDVAEAAREGSIVQVERHDPVGPGDSGFVLYLDTAPDDREPGEEDVAVCCLHCCLEFHPEAGKGLDLVKDEGGVARIIDGEWKLCSAS